MSQLELTTANEYATTMPNAFLINAHHPSAFSQGELNRSLVERATARLLTKGYELRHSDMLKELDTAAELDKHRWADVILLQTPVNWMEVPWRFKQYMDDVYSAGMGGELCDGDGRTRSDPGSQYGAGGTLEGEKYSCR